MQKLFAGIVGLLLIVAGITVLIALIEGGGLTWLRALSVWVRVPVGIGLMFVVVIWVATCCALIIYALE